MYCLHHGRSVVLLTAFEVGTGCADCSAMGSCIRDRRPGAVAGALSTDIDWRRHLRSSSRENSGSVIMKRRVSDGAHDATDRSDRPDESLFL